MSTGSPLRSRPCRDDSCTTAVVLAERVPTGKWRAFDATPVVDDRRAFAFVLIGVKAYRRADLMENYTVYRGQSDDEARALVDDYPHHLLHTHPEESEQ